MRKIEVLRNCTTQRDLARILGYPERKFTQILFTQNVIHQYKKFEISKKSGGLRTIYAPKDELKELQRRLSTYLQDCHKEIELHRLSNHQQISIKSFSSFAFRPKIKLELSNRILHFDIYNHALKHTNKKFVLNLDLENFFETITFSRIVGYFIKNESFLLEKDIAILIAQICTIRASQNEEGFLPQGSPTSPVISNLIANILDIKILRLAQKHKINYSRYADDITLSTNMREFPREIAYKSDDKWGVLNSKGMVEVAAFADNIVSYDGATVVADYHGDRLCFDRNGIAALPKGYEVDGKVLKNKTTGKFGVIDSRGNIKIYPVYDKVLYVAPTYAVVLQNGQYGILNY